MVLISSRMQQTRGNKPQTDIHNNVLDIGPAAGYPDVVQGFAEKCRIRQLLVLSVCVSTS